MANQEDLALPFPVRFSPDGPEGWMARPDQPLDHAELLKGVPFGLDHAYFERPDGRLKTGIWRCTAYSERYDGYPADEFMVVLEGEVTIEGEGFKDTYRKGDCFFVPKGFNCTWTQPGPMLKFYVIIG